MPPLTHETTAICFCLVLFPEHWILVDYTYTCRSLPSFCTSPPTFFSALSPQPTGSVWFLPTFFWEGVLLHIAAGCLCVFSAWRFRFILYLFFVCTSAFFASPFYPSNQLVFPSRMDGASLLHVNTDTKINHIITIPHHTLVPHYATSPTFPARTSTRV